MAGGLLRCGGSLAREGGSAAITPNRHLEDRRVVDEPFNGREGHGLVWEEPASVAEGLVGDDEDRTARVFGRDEFEQDGSFRLILGKVGDVVEDEEMELVELGDGDIVVECLLG
jgi:hypothetical protein